MTFMSILYNLGLCFFVYVIVILFPWFFTIFLPKKINNNQTLKVSKPQSRKKSYSYNIDISSEIYAPENFANLEDLFTDDNYDVLFEWNNLEESENERLAIGSKKSFKEGNVILDEFNSKFKDSLDSGVQLVSESKYSSAQVYFEEAYEINPSSTEINYRLARCYYKQGFLEKTLPIYRFLISKHPEKYQYLKQYGVILFTLGRYEDSIKIFQSAIKLRPNEPYAYILLGQNFRAQGNNIKARTFIDKALELDPKSNDANLQLAILFEKLGDFDSSIRKWKMVLKTNKDSKRARMGLARSYYRNGNYDTAYELFWEFIKEKCDRNAYLAGIYCVNISVNYIAKPSEIIKCCSTVISNFHDELVKSKNGHIPITQMALALLDTDELDFAKRLVKKYMSLFSNISEYYLLMSQISYKQNSFDDYLEYIKKSFSHSEFKNSSFNSYKEIITVDTLFSTSSEKIQGPLVSIVMTVYKNNPLLINAIESVLSQTYQNIELIIVDDCSPDKVVDLLRSKYKSDSRIKIIQMEKNGGTYRAKNQGMCISKGEFIAFHDSDDWMHPRKLEVQISHLINNENLVAVFSNYFRMDENGNIIFKGIGAVRPACISLVARKKQMIDEIGYFDSVRIAADSEYESRLEKVFGAKKILYLQAPYLVASVRSDSLSQGGRFAVGWSGISGVRLDYRKSYTKWHNSSDFTVNHYIPINQDKRKFSAPDETIA
ncbi:MAG: hypothetical protein CMB56_006850 [Methanobacteriota archaeon]|nr:MAG: hypothetical protein CMB56_006850 [Euryarchaeota archaeon]